MTAKKGYFKSFVKSGFLLHSTLITAVVFTLLVANYEYRLFNMLFSKEQQFNYVILVCSVFALFGLIYLFSNLKKSNVTFADAIYLSLIGVGAAFAIYVQLKLNGFNVRRTSFAIGTSSLGLLLLFIRAVSFKKINPKNKTLVMNKVQHYYRTVVNNYSMLGVLAFAGVTICIAYLVLNISFGKNLKDTTYLIVAGSCLLPLFFYALKSAFSKKVTVFDAFLLSGAISAPVVLAQILMVAYSQMRLTLWAAVFFAYLILYVLRFANYSAKPIDKKVCKCSLKGYYGQISKNHDPLSTLAIGGFIATVAITLLKGQAINAYLIRNGAFAITLKGLPVLVVIAAATLTLAFFAAVALIGVKKKEVFVGDYLLSVCFAFVFFGIITYFAYPSPLYLHLLIAFAAYCLVMTVTRMVITADHE